MDCLQVEQHLGAYADGELEPSAMVGFDQHLGVCPECRVALQVLRATKRALHGELSGARAPTSLQLRVGRALDKVDGREHPARSWGTVAAVAAVALVGASQTLGAGNLLGTGRSSRAAVQAGLTPIFEDVVQHHRDELPTEVEPRENPEQVTGWFRDKVAFRVSPVRFARPEVQLLGARIGHVHNQRAAELVYRMGNRRLTMVVFPASPELAPYLKQEHDEAEDGPDGLHHQRVGNRVVTYYTVKNYTVPIVEHDGIAYAFTGDLDRGELLQLMGSAKLP